MDFTKEKKIMADEWHFGMNHIGGMIGFSAGSEKYVFFLAAPAMKTLMLNLQKGIDQYESVNGEIDTSSSEVKVLSPIQQSS